MKHFLYLLPVAVVAGAMMTSCSSDNRKPLESQFETYGQAHVYTLVGVHSDFSEDNDYTVCDSVSLILPVRLNNVETPALRDTILQRALGIHGLSPYAAIDKWLDMTASEPGCEIMPSNTPADLTDGFQRVEGRIVNMSTKVLTYCIATSTYFPGAANGMYTLDYINYSMTTGHIVTLNDIFTADGLKHLPEVIAEQAKANPRYGDDVNIDALPENGNFFLSSEGEIVFSYQPMEVGPHSLGNVQVAFFPEELTEYMTPKAIEAFGLGDIAK